MMVQEDRREYIVSPPAPKVYLAVEGIDGMGKTTVVKHIEEKFGFARVKEPSDGIIGQAIHNNDWLPLTDFYLFFADRSEALSSIDFNGHTVTDRSLYSSYAYQGVKLENLFRSRDKYFDFFMSIARTLPRLPTHVIIIHGNVSESVDRVNKRGTASRFEKLEYLKKVQEFFLDLSMRIPGVRLVENRGTMNDLFERIDEAVYSILDLNGSESTI